MSEKGCCYEHIRTPLQAAEMTDTDEYRCMACSSIDTIVCEEGDFVHAVWAANGREYPALVMEDQGDNMVRIEWLVEGGEDSHNVVYWGALRHRKWNKTCARWEDGCAVHDQCGPSGYCFDCEICENFIDPAKPMKCEPCPTDRGGGCGERLECVERNDAIYDETVVIAMDYNQTQLETYALQKQDFLCPEIEMPLCECLDSWNVENDLADAPLGDLQGCIYDEYRTMFWCEVDKHDMCLSESLAGFSRSIPYNQCNPPLIEGECNLCTCDCVGCTASAHIERHVQWQGFQKIGEAEVGPLSFNCSVGALQRRKDRCPHCVECCVDYCTAASQVDDTIPDCAYTTIAGCYDQPIGWVDTKDRTCQEYADNGYCTLDQTEGRYWKFEKTDRNEMDRNIEDYASDGISAYDACCDCGGGTPCVDLVENWVDKFGNTCLDYESKRWCNRYGYGDFWTFDYPFGENIVDGQLDAGTACCVCGGGSPMEVLPEGDVWMDNGVECREAVEGAVYNLPPWRNDMQLCMSYNNICFHQVNTFGSYLPGKSQPVIPDFIRSMQICEQQIFITGKAIAQEDDETYIQAQASLAREAAAASGINYRLLSELPRNETEEDRERIERLKNIMILDYDDDSGVRFAFPPHIERHLTELFHGPRYHYRMKIFGQWLLGEGVLMQYDPLLRSGRSGCMWRLPDPFNIFGGPNHQFRPFLKDSSDKSPYITLTGYEFDLIHFLGPGNTIAGIYEHTPPSKTNPFDTDTNTIAAGLYAGRDATAICNYQDCSAIAWQLGDEEYNNAYHYCANEDDKCQNKWIQPVGGGDLSDYFAETPYGWNINFDSDRYSFANYLSGRKVLSITPIVADATDRRLTEDARCLEETSSAVTFTSLDEIEAFCSPADGSKPCAESIWKLDGHTFIDPYEPPSIYQTGLRKEFEKALQVVEEIIEVEVVSTDCTDYCDRCNSDGICQICKRGFNRVNVTDPDSELGWKRICVVDLCGTTCDEAYYASFGEMCKATWADGCSADAPTGLELGGETPLSGLCDVCNGCLDSSMCPTGMFCAWCDQMTDLEISRDLVGGACHPKAADGTRAGPEAVCLPDQVCTHARSQSETCEVVLTGCLDHDDCLGDQNCYDHAQCVFHHCADLTPPDGEPLENSTVCIERCGVRPTLGGYCNQLEGCHVDFLRRGATCDFPEGSVPCPAAQYVPMCAHRGFCTLVEQGTCIIFEDKQKVAYSCDCLTSLRNSPEGHGWCPQVFKDKFDAKREYWCAGTRRLTDEPLPLDVIFRGLFDDNDNEFGNATLENWELPDHYWVNEPYVPKSSTASIISSFSQDERQLQEITGLTDASDDESLWIDPDMMGPELKQLLEEKGISYQYSNAFASQWWTNYMDTSTQCVMPQSDSEAQQSSAYAPFKVEKYWIHGGRDTSDTCEQPRCNLDPEIADADECANQMSCDRNCLYCKSPPMFTDRQGICTIENITTTDECEDHGGYVVSGPTVHLQTGRFEQSVSTCVLPYLAETFCTGPSRRMRYCSDFHYSVCEEDVISQALGCRVDIERCRTPADCERTGYCKHQHVLLSGAKPRACIIAPVDPKRVGKCTGNVCFQRTMPPFAMEVVPRLEFLGPVQEGNEEGLYLPYDEATCLSLDPGAKWMERATSRATCEAWYGCCLSSHGNICAQYSGDIFQEDNKEAATTCEACGGTWGRIFEWAGHGQWQPGAIDKDPVGAWINREWAPANQWRETLDLEKVRLKLENSLEMSRSQARLNLVKCRFDMLREAIRVVAQSCGTETTTKWWHGDDLVPDAPLGTAIATPGTVSGRSLLFGRVAMYWHEHSVEVPTTISAKVVFFDLQKGMAAPKFILPGVLQMESLKVVDVANTTTTTTTTSAMGDTMRIGTEAYPQELIELMRVTTEAASVTTLSAAALQAIAIQAATDLASSKITSLSDVWDNLVNAIASFLRKNPQSSAPEAMRIEDVESCNTVVTNWQGRVVGKVIGDCVDIQADNELTNGIELCVPLRPSMDTDSEHFTVYDFAKKTMVPPYGFGDIQYIEDVPVTMDYGRVMPGWSIYNPLNRIVRRRGDLQLCAEVQHGWTYCPIKRMANDMVWPPTKEVLDYSQPTVPSNCPWVDKVFGTITQAHAIHADIPAYIPFELAIATDEILEALNGTYRLL